MIRGLPQTTIPNEAREPPCRNCAHMHPDRDGGRWCSSPQILKARGHSIRCIWERDQTREPGRIVDEGTAKCGASAINYKPRETV